MKISYPVSLNLLPVCVAIVMALLLPANVIADDMYSYINAAACVQVSDAVTVPIYRAEGYVQNNDASNTLELACPYPVASNGAAWDCAWNLWRVKDLNDGADVSCRLCSHGMYGSFSCGSISSTTGYSSSPQPLAGLATPVDAATYMSQCDLPPDDIGASNLYQLHLTLKDDAAGCP